MIPCIIESPFKGKNKAEEYRNRAYLEKLIRHVVERGYTPYASHKMLTNAFDDRDAQERNLGIYAGLDMSEAILLAIPESKVFFGLDYGETDGMLNDARPRYKMLGIAEDRIEDLLVGKL